jgi:B-cell receptor-associated protein 31|uniref:Endoplasmic reticulum transmembrane protein n=1 Tax=Panagrolaimus sp. PS1159 TaxID=55785 RepID=A0AC35FS36_9BILA
MDVFKTGKMTLQWTVVAFILYGEIIITLLLLLPWIRPGVWRRIFNSRLVQSLNHFTNVAQYSTIVVLLLLFIDAIREVRKYSDIDTSMEIRRVAETDATVHMRLFRAQRNLYISGFTLLLFLVIARIVRLILRSAHLAASAEASLRQAENASKTAKRLMEAEGPDTVVGELTSQMEDLQKKLKHAEADRDAMKEQAENLQKEYNRVSDELHAKIGQPTDKKDD